MRKVVFGFLVAATTIGAWSGPAAAQDASPSGQGSSIEFAPSAASKQSYDDYRREALERKAKRTRNALIGTSVAAVIGLPLWIAGGRTQCVKFDDGSGNTQTSCTTAGKAMLGIGYPLAIGGVTGALVSGIMLGVRKGKLRDMESRTKYSSSRRLHWDPVSSQFVF